jgi:hypothetical protein
VEEVSEREGRRLLAPCRGKQCVSKQFTPQTKVDQALGKTSLNVLIRINVIPNTMYDTYIMLRNVIAGCRNV